MTQEYKIVHYEENGKDIFEDWLAELKDKQGAIAVLRTTKRIEKGNFGDHKYLRDGVSELRIHIGAGYRVYYSMIGDVVVLLLCGGSKRSQEKDIDKALHYFIMASDLGDKEAAFHAGEILFYHFHDLDKAKIYLNKSSNLKSLGGMFTYGLLLIEEKDNNRGIKLIKEAAELGNGYALIYLGDLYHKGELVNKDDKEAFEYYLRASKLKLKEASLKVSQCYKEGIGVDSDLDKANYYQKQSLEYNKE